MICKVEDVRSLFRDLKKREEYVIDKTGVKTLEIIGLSFIADEDHIFGEPNIDYIQREINWYESESLYVADIPGKTPVIWEQVSSDHGRINSNYGWCIYSYENGSQYANVLSKLRRNRDTRQASMIYTRPTMHTDATLDGMSDFMCTHAVDYFIRDNKLHAVVRMRSNDVYHGYRNDYAWQKHVLTWLAQDLDVEVGDIIWQASSLHIYEQQFKHIK